MSDATQTTVEELRQVFRPGMTSGQAMVWVWGAAIGFGVWALGFVGAAALHDKVSPPVGAAAWLGWTVATLAVPGVGVLRPGGARGPVILRAVPTLLTLVVAGALFVDSATRGDPNAPNEDALRESLVGLSILASPLVGSVLAWAVLLGRSAVRSALLVAGVPLSWLAIAAAFSVNPRFSPGLVVSAILTLAALGVLVRARPRRGGLSAEAWIEAQAAEGVLRAGDEAWPMPEVFAHYRGVVSVPRDALPPQAPGRGARPPNPADLFPCTRAQVPWILRDLLDARLALALFLSTAAALAVLLSTI
ncbi:MAG: hypothetical protein U0325_32415 [Polyangiales bacterium]